MKIQLKTLLFIISLIVVASVSGAEPIIQSINISGNRVKESIIRENLGFKEGDSWNDSLIEKAKRNLFELKIFKELSITAEPSVSTSTVSVNIKAVDGWFFMPLPMILSRNGEQMFMLMFLGQNIFRKAEKLALITIYNEGNLSAMLNSSFNNYTLNLVERNTSVTEYIYEDSGLALMSYGDVPEDFEKYTVDYKIKVSEQMFVAGKIMANRIKISAGMKSAKVSYERGSSGVVPQDSGMMNSVVLSLNKEERETIKDSDGMGRMFGLGMAEVKEFIRTGKKEPSAFLWNVGMENSGKIISSDYPYIKTTVSLSQKKVFNWGNSLMASTRFTAGASLPLSQMPTTSQRDGLRGYYAREFRGDSTVNSYLSYKHPIHMTMTGYFSIESYCYWGVCFLNDRRYDRTGIGVNLGGSHFL